MPSETEHKAWERRLAAAEENRAAAHAEVRIALVREAAQWCIDAYFESSASSRGQVRPVRGIRGDAPHLLGADEQKAGGAVA